MSAYRNQYIDINKWTRGNQNNGVKKLAVHYTANPGASAANHYRYFKTLPAQNRNLSEKNRRLHQRIFLSIVQRLFASFR